MSASAFNTVVLDAANALARVGDLLSRDEAGRALLLRLGWQVESLPEPLRLLGSHLGAIRTVFDDARAEPDSPAVWLELADAVVRLATEIRALRDASFGGELDALDFGRQVAEQLVHWAAIEHLSRHHPRMLAVARAVGIVRVTKHPATASRPRYVDERFVAPDFAGMLESPGLLLRAAWAWGDPAFDGRGLLNEMATLFRRFCVPAGFVAVPPSPRELDDVEPGAMRWHLLARLLSGAVDGATYEAGLRLLPAKVGPDPAIAIIPYVEGDLGDGVAFGDGFTLSISGAGNPAAGRALLMSPSGLELVDDFFGGGGGSTAGEVSATLRRSAERNAVAIGPGELSSAGWSVRAAARANSAADGELLVEMQLSDARVGLPTGGSGLLGSLLQSAPLVPVPIAIGVSSRRGVYLGPAGLSHEVGVGVRVGPVEVRRATLVLDAIERGLRGSIGTSIVTSVGPVRFGLDGFGLALELTFPEDAGNLGPLDLRGDVIPPTGVGIGIDTSFVKGAGVITRHGAHEYRGAILLELLGVSATAIGLLDDSPGTGGSFAALAAARFPRIQLGWGFTLDGIGGVVAIHRRFDTDRVRADLAQGRASVLLDTRPPGGDLLTRIDAVAAFFPTARGRHVVGPTASIGWGTPKVLQADLALLLELPSPVRLAVVGAVQLGLPTLTKRVVDIRVDLLGVIDFERCTLALDASLHDSTIAGYALTGDMALRMGWGEDAHFLLAIGGFHPRFAPPPGFPALRRLALTAGDNPQFRLEAYLALTSNTAQVGAHAELSYEGSGFRINGQLGFDALFEFVPFHFEVDITASASISYRGHNLSSVDLAFLLTGPRPWHAKGHATFSIWRWEHSVDFDATWGTATPASLPPPPDVEAALRAALEHTEAWIAALPDGESAWITFATPSAADGIVRVHPLAVLTVRQRAMPLDYDITQFGNIPLPSARRFSIEHVRVGGAEVPTDAVEDRFARGQFTRLSSEQRLSAPSFERFHAGVRFGVDAVRVGSTARASMETDTVVDDPLAPPAPPPRIKVPASIVALASVLRPTRPPVPPKRTGPRVADLAFALVSTEDLSITALGAAIGRGARTYGALREALNRHIAETGQRPLLQVVPRNESRNGSAPVVVVREDDRMRNVDFVDTETGRPMTRAEFVDAIHAGEYADYSVKMIHGVPTPVSRPNETPLDNLG